MLKIRGIFHKPGGHEMGEGVNPNRMSTLLQKPLICKMVHEGVKNVTTIYFGFFSNIFIK